MHTHIHIQRKTRHTKQLPYPSAQSRFERIREYTASIPNSIYCWLYFYTAFFLSSRLQGRLRVTSELYIHLQ